MHPNCALPRPSSSSLLYLGFFLKLIPKLPFQHAPNTHLWLVLIHSGFFLSLPCCNKTLGGCLFYLHLFYDICLFLCDLLTPYTMKPMSFSSPWYATCLTFPCTVDSSPIILITSSCSGSNHCWRIFFWSLIFSTSTCAYHWAKMVVIRSTCGSVTILYVSWCSCSCTSLSWASMSFILGSSTNYIHTCALS